MGEEQKGNEPHQTRLEAFLAKKGSLLIRDIHNLGMLSGKLGSKITFEAVVLYEPGQGEKAVHGLKIEVTGGGQFERQGTSFLDLDEIESLSDAIVYILHLSSDWKGTAKEYSEAIFSTKADFKLGIYQKGSEQGAFASSGNVGGVSCFFLSINDLSSVKSIADKGLDWLRAQERDAEVTGQQRLQRPGIGPSAWDTLGVPRGATQDEINTAYHQMAQMYHPDKVASLAPEFKEIAERRMKEINAALETLKSV